MPLLEVPLFCASAILGLCAARALGALALLLLPVGARATRAHTTYVVCGVRVCLFLLKYLLLLISLAISMILGTNVYIYLLLIVPVSSMGY